MSAAGILSQVHLLQANLANQAIQAPGQTGQAVTIQARQLGRQQGSHELGIIQADDATGKIGSLKPGDAGYAQAALTSANRQVLLAADGTGSGKATIPAGTFFIVYEISGGTAADVVSKNPTNSTTGSGPVALFSIAKANPDSLSHVQHRIGNRYGWSTSFGSQPSRFRDLIVQIRMRVPHDLPDTTPPTASLSLSGTVPTTTQGFDVKFSEPMKLTDLAKSNYTLTQTTGPNAGQAVAIQSVQFVNLKTVHVTLASALPAGGYRFDVSPSLSDLSGNPLADPKSFTFTVA